ncbi:MAG TPA: hypothetical protein VKV26_01865 [Dehalococcoidia bacterium]|nr:hypothetical protein [Dehalococcoidia bacterium]
MADAEIDPLARKAQADLIVERAAAQLRRLVEDLALQLRPFPPFPGAFFTNAIEVEPDAAGSAERGCVVVTEDGTLHELVIGVEFDSPEALIDPVAARKEELQALDLHPRDYVVYAYNAVTALSEQLLERAEQQP